MHRAKQVWQWMRSLVAKMWQQTGTLMAKVVSLPKETKSRRIEDLIPPLAILIGAAAFGFWRQSFAAALFAVAGLSLLAGIHNNTARLLATLQRLEGATHFGDGEARPLAATTTANSGALDQAIGSLKPWLANQVSLTEENMPPCHQLKEFRKEAMYPYRVSNAAFKRGYAEEGECELVQKAS